MQIANGSFSLSTFVPLVSCLIALAGIFSSKLTTRSDAGHPYLITLNAHLLIHAIAYLHHGV